MRLIFTLAVTTSALVLLIPNGGASATDQRSEGGGPSGDVDFSTQAERSPSVAVREFDSPIAAQKSATSGSDVIVTATLSGRSLLLRQDVGAASKAAFSVNCPSSAPYSREVTNYNAAYLGQTYLRCGNSNGGYRHISLRHSTDWQKKLNQVGSTANWAQFMIWTSRQAFERPHSGYPKNQPGDKLCYSTPIIMRTNDGKVKADFNPTVVTGQATRFHVTSYPTRWDRC